MLLRIACALVLVAGTLSSVFGQDYPSRPIRIVVGFPPGAGVDNLARLIAQQLNEAWGQPVIVDNRAGAGGDIAADIVAHARGDGYTLLISSPGPLVVSPALRTKLSYSPLKDFAPVTLISTTPNALVVHPGLPVKSARELIAMARAKPGALNYPSSGLGSTPHLSGALFGIAAKIDIVHVPYKGGGAAMLDVVAGRMDLMVASSASLYPHIRANRVRPLAVTSLGRSKLFPDLPTLHETVLPGFEVATWYGMVAAAGVPRDVMGKIHASVVRILGARETGASGFATGMEFVGNTPAEFAKFLRDETSKWGHVIRTTGLKAQ